MNRCSFLATTVVLGLACAAPGQTYDIKVKFDPDVGKSVTYRDSNKETGSTKWLDPDGKLLKEMAGSTKEAVYTETVLESDKNGWTRLKRVYDKATEKEGAGEAKAKSYQGRTVVLERKDGKGRVGVVGKEALEAEDLAKLTEDAEEGDSEARAILKNLSPGKPVKVGDTWKLDMKAVAAGMKKLQLVTERCAIEVKLVKVYTRDKTLFGVFELKTSMALGGIKDKFTSDPPLMVSETESWEIAIDGSSTQRTVESKMESRGKSKLSADNKVRVQIEYDNKGEGRHEVSAEKADPKGRTAPEVAYWSDKPAWKTVTSKEEQFSIDFPGKPKEESKKNEKRNTTTKSFSVEAADVGYAVNCEKYEKEFTADEVKFSLKAVKDAAEKQKATVKDIMFEKLPGLEVVQEIENPKGKTYLIYRVFIVKNQVFTLMAVAPPEKKGQLDTDAFFKSFKPEGVGDKK